MLEDIGAGCYLEKKVALSERDVRARDFVQYWTQRVSWCSARRGSGVRRPIVGASRPLTSVAITTVIQELR